MADEYTPRVHAESATCELRKAWLEVLVNWPTISRDDELMADLRAIASGMNLKLGTGERKANAA